MKVAAPEVATASPINVSHEPLEPSRPDRRWFFLVAGGAALLSIAIVLVWSVAIDDGHLVYAIDDAGIHLSVARQLSQHGTWGVSQGAYVSASSSPAWTIVLSGLTFVIPSLANIFPLVLNIAAAVWIVWLFAANQTFIRPRTDDGSRDWLSYALAVFVPIVVLFVPAMVMVGMEHLLHAALVVQMLALLPRLERAPLRLRNTWVFLLVVLVAGAVRFESIGVAAGCALAIVARTVPRLSSPSTRANWRRRAALVTGALTVAVSVVPLLVYAAANRAFGEGFLPNSIAAKSAIAQRGIIRPIDSALRALESDTVLTMLLLIALAYVVVACFGGPKASFLSAGAFVVASLLHGFYSDMHFYERYQTYLVIAGTFVLLQIASEVVPARWHRAALATVLALLLVVAVPMKLGLVVDTPLATSNTYRQRYQMGRFFGQHYKGQAIATGELGYATYFHDGPVVDFLGLGSYEVVQQYKRTQHLPKQYIARLVDRHHVAAIGVYPATLGFSAPDQWYFAGEWKLDERSVSAFGRIIDFFAPNAALGKELDRKLHAFAPQLPNHVRYFDRAALVRRFYRAAKK